MIIGKKDLDRAPLLASFQSTDGNFQFALRKWPFLPSKSANNESASKDEPLETEYHLFIKPLTQDGNDKFTEADNRSRYPDGSICVGITSGNKLNVREDITSTLEAVREQFDAEFPMAQIQATLERDLKSSRIR